MGGIDKTTAVLADLPVAAYSLRAFAACAAIDHIVLVAGAENRDRLARLAAAHGGGKVAAIPLGGARRRDSVAAGLAAISDADLVAVHDTARPLVTEAMIREGIALAAAHGAAIVAGAVTDTIKQVAPGDGRASGPARIDRTIDRASLRAAQTPQTFRLDLLRRAHAADPAADASDDAALVEVLPAPVFLYAAAAPNPKITRPEDLPIVAALLRDGAAAERG
jgi:2-C-methyl-D-erythritol 4-phosphate cytidylyltransferase